MISLNLLSEVPYSCLFACLVIQSAVRSHTLGGWSITDLCIGSCSSPERQTGMVHVELVERSVGQFTYQVWLYIYHSLLRPLRSEPSALESHWNWARKIMIQQVGVQEKFDAAWVWVWVYKGVGVLTASLGCGKTFPMYYFKNWF